jgi:hypothetical protein
MVEVIKKDGEGLKEAIKEVKFMKKVTIRKARKKSFKRKLIDTYVKIEKSRVLADTLKAIISDKKSKARIRKAHIAFLVSVNNGTAAYDKKYDAYYNPKTGEWRESVCGDKDCQYCKNRPKRKKL